MRARRLHGIWHTVLPMLGLVLSACVATDALATDGTITITAYAPGGVDVGDLIVYECNVYPPPTAPFVPTEIKTTYEGSGVCGSASCSCNGSRVVTLDDIALGGATSVVEATTPGYWSMTNSVTTPIAVRTWTVSLELAAPCPGPITAGTWLTYNITVTNTGNVNNGYTVTDPTFNGVWASSNLLNIGPGSSHLLVEYYQVTAADVAAGHVSKQVKANAYSSPPQDQLEDVWSNTVDTPVDGRQGAFTVSKALLDVADPFGGGIVTTGSVLTYIALATNTGCAALDDIEINDPMLTPSEHTCSSLATGQSCWFTGTYTVTAADATNGSITNTVYGTSADVEGVQSYSLQTPVPTGQLVVTKDLTANADADGSGDVTQGDVLTYTVTALNVGGAPLTNVQVSDPLTTPNAVSCPVVAPANACVLVGTYTVTAADASKGSVSNTAVATSNEGAFDTDTAMTPVFAPSSPPGLWALNVKKKLVSSSGGNRVGLGDQLTYSVTARNSGSDMLTGVVVNDPLLNPGSAVCSTLATEQTCVLTGSYTVTASDVAAGAITNTGSASANEIGAVASATLTTRVSGRGSASMSVSTDLTNNTDPDSSASVTAGDALTYTVTATNTGTVTQTNVTVNDPTTTPGSAVCASVPVAASCVLSGIYTVTADDAARGLITVTGSANSNQLPSAVAQQLKTYVFTTTSPHLTLEKELTGYDDGDASNNVSQGDVLTYTVTATNTGNATLSGVAVDDPITTPSTTNCAQLAIGASCVLVGTYTVTANDAAAGTIANTATASSAQPSATVHSPTLHTTVFNNAPSTFLGAAARNDFDPHGNRPVVPGDIVSFAASATNNGNAALTNVHLSNPLGTPASLVCSSVAVGATCTLSSTYIVTAGDASNGSVANQGTFSSDQVPGPLLLPNVIRYVVGDLVFGNSFE